MIDPLEKLEAAATPRPWRCQGHGGITMDGKRDYYQIDGPHDGKKWPRICRSCPPARGESSDLMLIESVRNVLPELFTAVKAADKLDLSVTSDDTRFSYVIVKINRLDLTDLAKALEKLDEAIQNLKVS